MPSPTCVKCNVSFERMRSGSFVIEMFSKPPRPYKIWMADGWECPVCKARIMSGYGNCPISEHYQEDFENVLQAIRNGEQWVVECYERPADVPVTVA